MRKFALAFAALLLIAAAPSLTNIFVTGSSQIYYVRTDGNDSNACVANTAGGACLTVQAAFNKAASRIGGAATVQIGDGTYTGGLACNYLTHTLSSGGIVVQGNVADPTTVVIDTTSINNNAIQMQNGCIMTVQHLTLKANGSAGSDFLVINGAVVYANDIRFDAAHSMHMDVYNGGKVLFTGNHSIVGGAVDHYHCHNNCVIQDQAHTVTITGTPAFSGDFAGVAGPGILAVIGTTYSGSITGASLLVHNGGFVDTQAACASFFPGTAAVVGATGIDPATFGTCGGPSGPSPIVWSFNSGLNAQELTPGTSPQNIYLHGSGAGSVNLGPTLFKGVFFDATGTPTIGSGNCGATSNGTVAGDNTSGKVTIGASATASCQVSFSGTLANTPHMVALTPANAAAAALAAGAPFVSAISTTSFTFQAAVLANTTWYYQVR